MQSSSLYVTDGDEIDWAYGSQRIWMYTIELYPSHAQVSSDLRFYPPDEKIGPETLRNKEAIFYLIERAWCRWAVIGKTTQNCGPLFEDFEISAPWTVNPLGTDTAPSGAWQRGDPATTTRQSGTMTSGARALVTGAAAGAEREQLRRGRDHLDPRAAGPARLDDRLADVPLLLRPRLEFVVGRLLPRLCRARGRQPDDRAPGASGPRTTTTRSGRRGACRSRRGPARRSGSSSRRPTWSPAARSRRPSTTCGSRGP